MTSADSSREMEAARKRLAAAKSPAASTNLASVKETIAKMLNSAQALCDMASEEVKEAETVFSRNRKEIRSYRY